MSLLKNPGVAPFPEPPKFTKILGPSFILLGLGLGSGEIILWPYLVSNFGLGIIWGAVVGITFQFFINMEIERYTLARGESVFVGFSRLNKHLPIWFILSTFIAFGWPGIIASSAKIFGNIFLISGFQFIAIFLLLLIGAILTLGPVLYKTVERFQKTIIVIGVPSLILITLFIAKPSDYLALTKGIFGIGQGYYFFPKGISLLTFLAAFAFSGAGGNLNLAQSFYIREKGLGMGKYAHKIQSLLTGKVSQIELVGKTFPTDAHNVSNFFKWWKLINVEHFIVFLMTGVVSILLLALLAFSTTYGHSGNSPSIDFIVNEAQAIGKSIFPQVGVFFLLLTGTMLFATQFAVLDATSRIISENIILSNSSFFSTRSIPKAYYFTLWGQICFSIIILTLGFSDPRLLITVGAVLNAFAMFVHIGLTQFLNAKLLPAAIKPSLIRKLLIFAIFGFFGVFSLYSLTSTFK